MLDVGTIKPHLIVLYNQPSEGPHGDTDRKATKGALQLLGKHAGQFRHLLGESMEQNVVTVLRYACHVQASSVLPSAVPSMK